MTPFPLTPRPLRPDVAPGPAAPRVPDPRAARRPVPVVAAALVLAILVLSPAAALDPERRPNEYLIADWNTSDGIPYTAVRELHQSADGYLWVCTRGGLARFDGRTFTAFTKANTPALLDEEVFDIADTADGTIWAATQRGVLWYQEGRWYRPPELLEIDAESVRWLERDGDAMLIASTGGIHRFGGGRLSRIPVPAEVDLNNLRGIRRAGDQDWIIIAQTSWRLLHGEAIPLADAGGTVIDEVYAAVADTDGTWWIGAEGGLYQLRGRAATLVPELAGRAVPSTRCLLFDRDHNLWIGTRGDLLRHSPGRIDVMQRAGHDTTANFLCLLEDSEGNLWGGNDRGLVRISDAKVTNIAYEDGFAARSIVSVMRARDDSLWAGSWGGGLTRLSPDGRIEKIHTTADGLATETIWNLAEAPDGTIWFGYYNQGIGRLRDGVIRNIEGIAITKPRIRDIKVTGDGTPWISTWASGLARVDQDEIRPVHIPGIETTRALLVDSDDRLWLSWSGGLGRLNDPRTALAERHDGGPASRPDAVAMLQDERGDIWVLREEMTIERLHAGAIQTFRLPAWVGRLTYSGVLHDGELWINFRNGIFRAPISAFDRAAADGGTVAFEFFRESDGMRSVAPNVYTGQGATVGRDGRLYFATSSGIAVIDPRRIRRVSTPPAVLIEQVVVDRTAYAPGALRKIPPGRGEVQIAYTALGLTNASLNRFRYRLIPFDRDWVEADRHRTAYYGGLSPGDYRFEVVAANADGVWNTAGAACEFRLPPRFYQSWWFYGAIVLALPLGIWAYIRRHEAALRIDKHRLEEGIASRTLELHESNRKLLLQVRETALKAAALQEGEERIRRLNEELESRVAERTAELQSANRELESFTYSVSHDLRAPLRGIDGWSLAIIEDHGASLAPAALSHLHRVRAESQRLGQLIDELLKLSRTTRAELTPVPIAFSELADATAARVAATRPEARVHFACQPGLRTRGDTTLLEAALFNLLDNAWKFSARAARPQVEFGLTDTPRGPAFFVRDNGAGFDMRHVRKLFGIFQRMHTQEEFPGTGVGLATVQRIIQRHGGTIWAESTPGMETTFYFTIGL